MGLVSFQTRKLLRQVVRGRTYENLKELYHRKLGPNRHLEQSTGVIHVGANAGQEREMYDLFDLDVIWIEPIPEVFEELQSNISHFPKQRAYQRLVTDVDGGAYTFHVASNNGQSSSVFDLSRHTEVWPEIHYSHDVHLQSTTLSALVRREQIDLNRFQTLVMDTQGSELLVLKGAADVLSKFRFIKTEAADFEAYKGCCRADELTAFVAEYGFSEKRRDVFKSIPETGTYWEILYRRAAGG